MPRLIKVKRDTLVDLYVCEGCGKEWKATSKRVGHKRCSTIG